MKCDMQGKRKPMVPIVTVLDSRFKLGHIPHGEHKFFMETLFKCLNRRLS